MNLEDLNEQLDAQRKKVDSDNFDITVREIVRMANEGELDRAPEYQRQFRWDEEKESRLIESIFLGLPVPTIYLATNKDGTWELIDGLQRVSTLIHYVADPADSVKTVGKELPLKLDGLNKLSAFNGLGFVDLPVALQLAFLKRPLRVTALSDKSDVDVRFDMFERLNTGGVVLTPQEIRACIFRGPFNDFIEELASNTDFQRMIKLQEGNQNDGTKEELVLKLFAYLESRERFDGKVKDFLNKYAQSITKGYDYDGRRSLFESLISKLSEVITGPVLRRNVNWTPLNLFEAILVGGAEAVLDGTDRFTPGGDWLNDEELTRFSTKGTNTRAYLNGRIKRAKELLLGAAAS